MARANARTEDESLALDVETKLVAHYLLSTGPGGSSSLTHIDASRLEIAECLGLADPELAILRVRDACGSDLDISEFLAHGTVGAGMPPELPGFFRYLVLTCIVVANADQNEVTQEFGKNLQLLLNSSRYFGHRDSLPRMWRQLALWAEQRRQLGMDVRSISLPRDDPRARHLGLTNALSFPSWRDTLQLRSLFEKSTARSQIASPRDAALIVCPRIKASTRFSSQMQVASNEFEALHRGRASLLATHRFWAAVRRALELKRPKLDTATHSFRAELIFGAVLEDTSVVFIRERASGPRSDDDVAMVTCSVDEAPTTCAKLLPTGGDRPNELQEAWRAGAIPFVQEKFGVWMSSFSGGSDDDQWVYLVRADRVGAVHRLAFVKTQRLNEQWHLIEPVSRSAALHIHHALDLHRGQTSALKSVFRMRGGVRTAAGYLGRSALLPWIEVDGTAQVAVGADDDSNHLIVRREDGLALLSCESRLDGRFRLTLEDRLDDERVLSVERSIRFVSDSPEHRALRQPSALWRDKVESSAEAWVERPLDVPYPASGVDWLDPKRQEHFDDLLELIYARGQSAWAERDLIEAIRALAPGPSPWDVLRTLQETGWLIGMTSARWRANLWRLNPPSLRRIKVESIDAVVLHGSTSASIRTRFQTTTAALGGAAFVVSGVGSYSPGTLAATGVGADSLATELNMPIQNARTAAAVREPRWWPHGLAGIEQHDLRADWSWVAGEFKPLNEGISTEDVEVRWWRRDENDRADLFSVDGGAPSQFVSPSRAVALTEAFRRARRPMFEPRGSILLRLPKEGHLPLHLAHTMHAGSLVAPGVIPVGNRWRYAYPASQIGLAAIRDSLGRHFILNDAPPKARLDVKGSSLIGFSRHRGARSIRNLAP